ncbi:hypothetical protein [Nonomuraea terrae]|uniref:hypothetical protein n=1 Tax=Nonomuraea terrae TaxID=2530383 RepID=UPI00140499A1|nr:hypothetical protein [Nonomuraea terrae]
MRQEVTRADPPLALFARFPGLGLAVPVGGLTPLDSFIANGRRALPMLLRP